MHGHDEAARNELELILRRLNLLPFILQNSSSGSKTLIEALEARIINDAAFGIVLVTPDDVGYSIRDGEAGAKARARQNVVLEMGMVMAALSRSRMVIIKKRGDVELPSDTDGIVRLEYQTRVQEQVPGLVQHLMDAGIAVDPALIADAAR
ncbi:nucleotide-binding protein [Paracoccus sp. WLY502]|uniref:nucleotide-binding protein n=1 Tax=Paracoccus yibinensis TaxID=3068891 RepID=UPI00279677FA|nr:nucleotide-binding protein [Paracoccus sp. WLY502]MDQ1898931.1 nucleotide-binding protein [Paracoccus sp. WLY502]